MARFVTANGKTLWAAIDPDARCEEPQVRGRKFAAFLTPFKSEGEAAAALVKVGGVLDLIQAPVGRGPRK